MVIDTKRKIELYGENAACFKCQADEKGLVGAAGTGKTVGNLEDLNDAAIRYPGSRQLMLRKTRASLTQSAMVTFNSFILPNNNFDVHFHTGSQEYRYPNGSVIVVGGLDKATKVLSSEYDRIYINEANETLENDYELCTTRLRHGKMPFQQMLLDTNPAEPQHWIKRRADRGTLRLFNSRHVDNPSLFDRRLGRWTDRGLKYLERLKSLTGVRRLRYLLGRWAAAEGLVYDEWNPKRHLIYADQLPLFVNRYLSLDSGYTNPAVCQWWGEDYDGRLYRYRELYVTQKVIHDFVEEIIDYSGEEAFDAVICEHDPELKITLQKQFGASVILAPKDVKQGIQAVKKRLARAGDGKPRLYYVRDSLVYMDNDLKESGKPYCTEQEFDSYVWDRKEGKPPKEDPIKENDHGMDASRYLVYWRDKRVNRRRAEAD